MEGDSNMFDKIVFISNHAATIKLKDSENITMNLMNLHLVFEDETKKILGEVDDVNGDTVNASFLGEIVGDKFLGGTIRKPRLDAKVRVINKDEISLITGKDEQGYMALGDTPFYDGTKVYLDVNNFFNSHFAIMGNSGSGKSCGISRLFQNVFHDTRLNPCNANIIMMDSSGEYYNAFSYLNAINPNYHYRFISTNTKDRNCEELRVPIYLLNEDDLALLLQATSHSQLPIVERMRKLALVFSQKDMDANNYKNYLIAKAIMTILYTNETAPNKRNEVFSILASCSTPQFNLEAVVQGIGYTRKFRECFLIDNSGNFSESVLLTEYVSSFINDAYDSYEPKEGVFYTLDTLEKALNFTLISEGWLRNENTYGDAVTLKVRLHSLVVSDNARFFDVKEFVTVEQFIKSLLNNNGQKFQFVNINLDDVDDDFAKVITKIYSRLIFDYAKGLTARASIPFHLVIEEAHRYIQNDNDRFLIGYNIFERIAKEGRKYGVILGIITQRPVELSDTVISQCSNFLIFKMNHPVDVDYIRKMVPNISDEIVEKQKTLQAGTCLGFGTAFKIPMIVKMDMPNPEPWSGNCNVVSYWGGNLASVSNSINNSVNPIASTLVNEQEQISIPTVVGNIPKELDNASAPSSLVKLNEDAEITYDAGEFGLLTGFESPREVNIPTTDAGVNLVALSGTGNATKDIVDNIQIPSIPTMNSSVTEKADNTQFDNDLKVGNIPTLVTFNNEPQINSLEAVNANSFEQVNSALGSLDNSSKQDNTGANLVSNTSASTGMVNLVSFNTTNVEPPQTVNMPNRPVETLNSRSNSTPNNGTISGPNIMAAPKVDINAFVNTGNGVEEEVENKQEQTNNGNITMSPVPSIPTINSSSVQSSELPKTAEQLEKQQELNDTFGKPDFSALNSNQMPNMTKVSGNDNFTDVSIPGIPSDINFGGEDKVQNNSTPTSFDSEKPLVSFLEQM